VVPACEVTCRGKWIEDDRGVVNLCVPPGLRVESARLPEHGALHYKIRGKNGAALYVISGLYFSGRKPTWATECASIRWVDQESSDFDCHLVANGRASRYISLNLPMGFASYENIPVNAAVKFNQVLDSLCWTRPVQTAPSKRQ
jgi:hypothetical protein